MSCEERSKKRYESDGSATWWMDPEKFRVMWFPVAQIHVLSNTEPNPYFRARTVILPSPST